VSGVAVALETSARAASVAVRSGERSIEIALEPDRAHAGDLLPAIDRAVRELGRSPREIGLVRVGTGPGSYTGLRVGIATALGIARGTAAQLRGVPSGETLAFGELVPGEESAVVLDARAGELYFALFRRTASEVEILRAPCVLRPEELVPALPGGGPIFGDRAALEVAAVSPAVLERFRPGVVPRAAALLALGAARVERLGPESPESIRPLYLRPFAVRARRR